MRTLALALLITFLANVTGVAAAQDGSSNKQRLQVSIAETGIYDFCLSYEDARVKRDALMRAINQGLPVEAYSSSKPRTRCYRNSVSFVPLSAEPGLSGLTYIFTADPSGVYGCPKGVRSKRCSVGVKPIKFIKAEILYSKSRFPIFVELRDHELVDRNGTVLTER